MLPFIPKNIPSETISINVAGGSNETPTLFPSLTVKSLVTTFKALFPRFTLQIIRESAFGCLLTLMISPTFTSIPMIGSSIGPNLNLFLRPKMVSRKNLTLAMFSSVFSLSSFGAPFINL